MRPVLLHLPFGLPLYSYGFMLLVSFGLGFGLALRLAARDGLDRDLVARSFTWIAVSSLVGARLLFVLTNPGQFPSLLRAFNLWQGGLVAYGGFLGGFAGALAFCRAHGIRFLALADSVAPSLGLGLAFTRVGCLLAGCDFGAPWDGPWAIRFPAGSAALRQQQVQGLLASGATESLPVHPTQVYESLVGFTLLGLVLWVRRRRAYSGQAFAAFVMGYAVLRGAVEVFRADADRGGFGPLSTSQLVGVATFVAAAAFLRALERRYRRDPTSMRLWEGGRAMSGSVRRSPRQFSG